MNAMTSTHPMVIGKSRVFKASTNSFPIPFQPKIISTNTAPASREANQPEMVVMMGLEATGKMCLKSTFRSGNPFALAVRTKSLALPQEYFFALIVQSHQPDEYLK